MAQLRVGDDGVRVVGVARTLHGWQHPDPAFDGRVRSCGRVHDLVALSDHQTVRPVGALTGAIVRIVSGHVGLDGIRSAFAASLRYRHLLEDRLGNEAESRSRAQFDTGSRRTSGIIQSLLTHIIEYGVDNGVFTIQ